ncbi:nucleoside-diphosphate sugar epimerase/dehydratase [Pedobacter sp. SYSU D00535]|uniref:polysaccharide biosynthesis protein n=1 Tax=Pedobacter sp. SYSU D00535 TaxID=2810308 RepID=UPI001F60D751|nr:nucleoside-diphosphate sugar epimerase/dehydratase [Pedobacter sp. SYSU D00535]
MIPSILFKRAQSRWLILLVDLAIIAWAFSTAFLVTRQFDFPQLLSYSFQLHLAGYCTTAMLVFVLMRIHTGIIRFSNTEDIIRIFSSTLLANISYSLILQWSLRDIRSETPSFKEVIILNFFISSTLLIMLRLFVKSAYNFYKGYKKVDVKPILIYGSGKPAVLIKQAFESHPEIKYEVLGFLDHDADKLGKYIERKRVYNDSAVRYLKEKYGLAELIISSNSLNTEEKKRTVETCINLSIKVLTVPPANEWLHGHLNLNQVSNLKIEDLLEREPILLDKKKIMGKLAGKRILITGAAGSIGSEIVRQVMGYNPEKVILVDQAESPMHELQLELEDKNMGAKVKLCIANIQNYRSMHAIFHTYRPQVVFHAAAYKHVPMMENNPREAILDNVLGTKNLAEIAVEFYVERFIMISTDKAVNPTNVMGASKRLAEMYIQSLNCHLDAMNSSLMLGGQSLFVKGGIRRGHTKFITTRFGNVLGSNGSVLHRFKAQIERGGPVTVTHPEITRYFMTIPESVQLVLEASAMGRGGEILIFDMGKPVKIVDLAANMIRLSGYVPYKDIQIAFSGLRPGEKLYEELLNKEELSVPTHHHKIKISKVIVYPYDYVQGKVNELLKLNESGDEFKIVAKIKEIIPEYKSNNSRFKELDQQLQAVS